VATGELTLRLAPMAWFAIAGLAIICTGVSFIAFFRGLAVLGPVRTAIISTIEPFWTALMGALILSQPLTPRTALGGVLIAAAVILLQRAAIRRT
jgi:drug/metabolite transporter (DMT)-like permease